MSYLPDPPKASMLYALESPPKGGDTGFVSMYAAYEALPAALQQRISGLSLKHDATYNSGGYLRQGVEAVDDPLTSPGAGPPLVCKHPKPGHLVLFPGRRAKPSVTGLALLESQDLM